MKASSATSSTTSAPASPPRANAGSSSSTADRFALTGPSLVLDPRVHAYRRDVADIGLVGRLFAPHYARPLMRSCGSRSTYVRWQPGARSAPSSELLPGEGFAMLDVTGAWAWGYCRADHYVGYVEAAALVDAVTPTHIVIAADAAMPMGSRVFPGEVAEADMMPIGDFEVDWVAVGERLLGRPYLLGGRGGAGGIDCSGLVQLALALCGVQSPRDSDQQRVLGDPIDAGDRLRRGDLVFFEGHVGLMRDAETLLHATGHYGKTVIEPLANVAARTRVLERRRIAR